MRNKTNKSWNLKEMKHKNTEDRTFMEPAPVLTPNERNNVELF